MEQGLSMSSGELLVKVCPCAGDPTGSIKTLVLCDRDGHPLPNQAEVKTEANSEGASVTVTFIIDGAMVQWA